MRNPQNRGSISHWLRDRSEKRSICMPDRPHPSDRNQIGGESGLGPCEVSWGFEIAILLILARLNPGEAAALFPFGSTDLSAGHQRVCDFSTETRRVAIVGSIV